MSPAAKFAFLVVFVAVGSTLTEICQVDYGPALVVALITAFVAALLMAFITRPKSHSIKIGDSVFTDTVGQELDRRRRAISKWTADKVFGSAYYYSIIGVVIWSTLSTLWFYLIPTHLTFPATFAQPPLPISAEALRHLSFVVLWTGLGSGTAVWFMLLIGEATESPALSRLLPFAVGAAAAVIQQSALALPLLPFVFFGSLFPFLLIPVASWWCRMAGLR